MTIGDALKKLRQERGLTQKEMVGNILSPSAYSKIENNVHNIDADTLFLLLALHNIKFDDFFGKVRMNYISSNDEANMDFWSKELENSFYKNDIELAEKIKMKIDNNRNASLELKLRAILIVAVLKEDYTSIDINTKKLIFRKIFTEDNWTDNQNSLRLFGNSMFLWSFEDTSIVIGHVFKKYKNIRNYSSDIQERIGQICSNYLYNGRNHSKMTQILRAITLLKKMDESPHLILYKMIGNFFEAYYANDTSKMIIIKSSIKSCGFKSVVNKLLI